MFTLKALRPAVLSVFIALALCAISATPGLAGDGDGDPEVPGLPPDTGEVSDPSAGEIESLSPLSSTEDGFEISIPADPAVGEEPALVEDGSNADDPALALPASEPAGVDESVTVVVEIDLGGDPIWCPAAVGTPLDGAAGCTSSYASLQALISYLSANQPSVDGVIWLEKSYDSSVNDPGVTVFTLDGLSLTTMANYKLTVRGGWDGLGTKTVTTSDPSEINARLEITAWNNDVTITGVDLTGASGGANTLYVTTSKKITLDRVRVEGNTTGGAVLDNRAGTADVIINNSQFNANASTGLYVMSNGNITVVNTSANANTGTGATLNNSSAATAKSVTMKSGAYEFNDNGSYGLYLLSTGSVNLKDITATGNGTYGAWIDNAYGASAGVTLTGTNIFSENTNNGLYVFSKGIITANNLVANANTGTGAVLDNESATTPKSVILTGASEFKFNVMNGLWVNTSGAITLANITASYTSIGGGCFLDNANPGASANVTLSGVNTFNNNASSGLDITSYGVIAASNLTANDNGWSGMGNGAFLNNQIAAAAKAVTLTGINTFQNNYNEGLKIFASGPITTAGVTASNNQHGYGVYLDNSVIGPSAPQNITLNSFTTATGNYSSGLSVTTYGNILGSNLTINDNGTGTSAVGAVLNNFLGGAYLPRTITLNGTNSFNRNGYQGLAAYSLGNITVYNVTADNNDYDGAYLSNNLAGGTGSVSIMGTNDFSGNINYGLYVLVAGNILVQDIDAVGNGGYGAYLNNVAGVSSTVSVGTSRKDWCNLFNDNDTTGLQISTNGAVTLSNICSYWNGDPGYGLGVLVNNTGAATPKPVTLKGANKFSNNYSGGLEVYSHGAITASSLTANDNGGDGIHLVTAFDTAVQQNVVLTGVNSFASNANYGLYINTYGGITASNIAAEGNLSNGAYLDNYLFAAVVAKPVLLTGTNRFVGNGGTGFSVSSFGPITTNNLTAADNAGYGAYLTNNNSGAVGGISVLGTSTFSDNGASGIEAWSRGAIVVQDINSSENSGNGVLLSNMASGSTGGITLGTSRTYWCNTFDNNNYSGLETFSNGAVTLSNVCAAGNGNLGSYGYGVYVDNTSASVPNGVILNGTVSAIYNFSGGINVRTRGPVTAANLYASANYGTGAVIVNNFNTASQQNVTINGTNGFWSNLGDGLRVYSYGAIQVSNLDSGWNTGSGVVLDNYGGVAIAAKPITITGSNIFFNNGVSGLTATSWGAISASNLTAVDNDDCGAFLDNSWGAGSAGGITLSGTNTFDSNALYGLNAISTGPVLINNLNARYNESYGVYINSVGLTAPQKVTLTGTNNIIGNGNFGAHSGSGLTIMTDGQITLNNLTASNNAYAGAILDNYTNWKSGTPGLVLTGTNAFDNNYDDGLYFNTVGAVTLTKLSADGNGGSGIYGLTDGKVNISYASLTANGVYGWYVWCPDIVTLKGVFAYGNGVNGLLAGGGTLIKIRS